MVVRKNNVPGTKLVVEPDAKWVDYAAEVATRFADTVGFSEPVQEMISSALKEVCDELVQACRQAGINETYEVNSEYSDGAVIIRVVYSDQVPLTIPGLADGEGLSKNDVPQEVSSRILMADLITKEMDRVLFRVDGPRRMVEMWKYPREPGKERQIWVLGLAPKIRDDLEIDWTPGDDDGLPARCVIRDPVTDKTLAFDAAGAFVVQRLDGKANIQEIYFEYVDRVGLISPKRMALIFEKMESAGLLEGFRESDRENRFRRILRKLMSLDFAIPRSDALVSALYPWFRFLINPVALIVLIGIGVSGLLLVGEHFSRYVHLAHHLGAYSIQHPGKLALLYVLVLFCLVIHEMAHAVVCKHYGGRIDRMGIMFYLAFIIFYCDVSASWQFLEKRKRILVALGGPVASFAILGIQLWITEGLIESNSPWEFFWLLSAVFTLISLIMNFNPFLKMDSYYILMDLLGIANLREKSFAYIAPRLFGWITPGNKRRSLPATRYEQTCFWLYGISGGLITLVFLLMPMAYLGLLVVSNHGTTEAIVSAIVTIALVLVQRARWAYLKYQALAHREYRLS